MPLLSCCSPFSPDHHDQGIDTEMGSIECVCVVQKHKAAVSHHLLGAYQKSLVEVIRAQQGCKAAPGGLAVRHHLARAPWPGQHS